MIYRSEQRASEVAKDLNDHMLGCGKYKAALTTHGWTIRIVSPYSNGDVIRWSEE